MNSVTTATPTMRADAVPAVRRGLRIALSRAERAGDTAAAGVPARSDGTAGGAGDDRPEDDDADDGEQRAEPGEGQTGRADRADEGERHAGAQQDEHR